ncbi:MAG: hypothetical protein U1C33_00010, partial [Candidatus Cloacimonadaceae bacterium]|nr:hypothetical protein [Candidatus Cloacimonadaceae bacterium]
RFVGGTSKANLLLEDFIEHKLSHYAAAKSDPAEDYSSNLSPYLHFGQISVLEIVLAVLQSTALRPEDVPDLIKYQKQESGLRRQVAAFLEELIIRRELSMNFCEYNTAYDLYDCIPHWARADLEKHCSDERPWNYSLDSLEEANTHDIHWNAAQKEMLLSGKMHNYMRMYWGKKIMEWSFSPEEAFYRIQYLNNKYCLDGRDPNSFAGIAWCFGKHDRPWQERKIFGKVRYMNSEGLKRKFDMPGYHNRIAELNV